MRLPILSLFILVMVNYSAHAEEPLSFSSRFTECVNHWVVLQNKNGEKDYSFGFIYIDEQAGFTYHAGGRFSLDDSGHFIKIADEIFDKKASFKMRLVHNGIAALLPNEAINQLGLPEKPDWLKIYDDGSNSPYYRMHMGFWFNALGDYKRALVVLESAYKDQPEIDGLEFELAFAYNALEQFDKAIPILSNALKRDPLNFFLGSEIAYANYKTGKYQEAIDLYLKFIDICPDVQMELKSQMAINLAGAYSKMGLNEEYKKWLEQAKKWAPEGSSLSQYFKQDS